MKKNNQISKMRSSDDNKYINIPLVSEYGQINEPSGYNDREDSFCRNQQLSCDFIQSIQFLTLEKFLEQNFKKVSVIENQNQNEIFHSFNNIINEKIKVYQEKSDSYFKIQFLNQIEPQFLVPNPISFQFDKTKNFQEFLNNDSYFENNQDNAQYIVINMPNPQDIQQKALSKEQLKQIKEEGVFFTYKNNKQTIKWAISKSFYIPQKEYPFYNNLQEYKKFLKEAKSAIYNEYNFNEWRNKGVINLGVGSNLSISLLQGLIRIIRIPKNLIALLIGEPFYFVSTSTSKHTISSQIKNDFKNQIQKKFRYKIKSTGFLNQMSTMQFIAEDYLADALSKIERGELVIKEGQNIKDVLLFYCYHQFTIEFGKMLGKEGERQLNESEIQYLQQNFLAYQIIEPVIRERNVDYKQISIEYNQQRIDLLKEYQLDSQYQLASALFKNLQSFELKYPPSHGYFFDFIEFKNGSLKADTYFWKFKYIMQMLKESCVSSNSLKDTLIYGKYGWEVCFKAESKQNGYKTLTRRFQDIKNEINRSQRQGDEDDDSDGIFGPCCSIAYECCNNYLYKYFLKGILFTSIFLRLICLSWLIIFGALYIIQFVSLRPIFVSIYLFNILIYDFTLPDTNIYTYPKYFPLFMIIFRFFLAVLTIILYSYVLVSSIAIECVKYICYWTLTVPTRIKNSLSYLLIYFLAQVPQTDSKYCKQDKNIYKDSYQYYQLTFEQIKIFIDSYFQKIPFEILIQNLDIYMKNQDAQNKLFLQKINNYLPFSSQQSKIQEMCQHYQKHFKKNLEEMIKTIESKFIQIQYNSNMSFKYSKQEYNKLFQNVSDYLRTKYGSQKKFEKMWSYFNCEQDNYDDFTLQMLNLIFFNKKFDKNESKLSLIFNMEKDQNILNQVNIYLQNKYDMQPDSITKADLNFQVCFFNFINEYNI